MKLEDLGEFGLIERIRKSFLKRSQRAPIGIGDDAAALSVSPGKVVLATTDMLVEGVHFDLATTDFYSLGWKSVAVNLSDIAAMGGTPLFCLIALAIPRRITVEQVSEFYRGGGALLRSHRVLLVGGDTCGSKQDLGISVTLLGEASKKRVLKRSGARPGDLIFVTGTLGDSGAGLEIVRNGKPDKKRASAGTEHLIERHLRPVPRVAWGKKLAASGLVTAMIDVSDGLSSDLGHICEESGCGADIYADKIPLSKALRSVKALRRLELEYALSGGEDYELLFTASVEDEKRIKSIKTGATVIGAITTRRGMRLFFPTGEVKALEQSGYDHFRATGRGAGK